MGNVTDAIKYDLKSIFAAGDLDTVNAEYRAKTGLPVVMDILIIEEPSLTEDGVVVGSYLTARILKEFVPAPENGDTFYVASTLKTYKVLEVVTREAAYVQALVEVI